MSRRGTETNSVDYDSPHERIARRQKPRHKPLVFARQRRKPNRGLQR
jgi:hypothetical protein